MTARERAEAAVEKAESALMAAASDLWDKDRPLSTVLEGAAVDMREAVDRYAEARKEDRGRYGRNLREAADDARKLPRGMRRSAALRARPSDSPATPPNPARSEAEGF